MTQYGSIGKRTGSSGKTSRDLTNDDMSRTEVDWMRQATWTSTSTMDSETIYLVVSGKRFCISRTALLTFPRTKLGQLALRHGEGSGPLEYVFDRNSKTMAAILDLYRTGELHLPTNLCCMSIRQELLYWEIPDELISECCYGRYKDALSQRNIVDELDRIMVSSRVPANVEHTYKDLIWQTMEKPGISVASWMWLGVYMTFIALSIVVVCLSTMERFRVVRDSEEDDPNDGILENLLNSDLNTPLTILDAIGLVFFTLEPVVRLMVTPTPKRHMKQFLNVLDFFLAADHCLCFLMERAGDLLDKYRSVRYVHAILRSLLSIRVLRIFHLARRFIKMKALLLTLRASIGEILLLFLGVSIAVIIFATSIYYVEAVEGENNFKNIPQAIWWAIITMTTVGYGDYYPVSVSGYIVGTLCALSGLLLLSMPIAIIANNFNTYSNGVGATNQRYRRRMVLQDCMNKTIADMNKFEFNLSENNWTASSSNKIHRGEPSVDVASDFFQVRKGGFYLNGPWSSPDNGHFQIPMRRLSEGAVQRKQSHMNQAHFVSADNLKPAFSERILYNHDNNYPLSKDSIVKGNEYTPQLFWKSSETSNHSLNYQNQNEVFSSDNEERIDNSFNFDSKHTDLTLSRRSNSPDVHHLWSVSSTQTERARKRKYRRRRKTWGSLPRLPQLTGRDWTARQRRLRDRSALFKYSA